MKTNTAQENDNKAKLLSKLREPSIPIMTQVVRVEEPVFSTAEAKKTADKVDGLEQFNAKVPAELLRRARRYKADTRKTMNEIASEALMMYLDSLNAR